VSGRVLDRLLTVAFAIVMAGQVALLVLAGVMVATLPVYLWQSSPWRAVLFTGGFLAALALLWLTHRRVSPTTAEETSRRPEINASRIPMSGSAGAVYMLQFLVWAVLSPAIGLFFAVLVGGAVLLLPLVFHLNRPGGGGVVGTLAGGAIGALCGLAALRGMALTSAPLTQVVIVSLCLGGLAGPLLVWHRSRREAPPSIKPYARHG